MNQRHHPAAPGHPVLLVSGASSDLGAAIAARSADEGAVLLGTDASERYRDLPFRSPRRWRSSRTGGSWRRGARAPAATTS